jgi:spore germination cell wall hydrolase CwlJ-like protein
MKFLSTITLALFMAPMAQPSLPSLDEASFRCLMATLYHEARGEGVQGIEAVASVVMNRARQANKSVCSVVYERKQFSWVFVTKDKRMKGNIMDVLVVTNKALNGYLVDITGGATHYHATYVKPRWAKRMLRTVKINNHIFYKENK